MADRVPLYYVEVPRPWKPEPAEYLPGEGWFQGGHRRRVKKPHYHFVWPKDGKRGGTMGRWKDILGNKGPDIHVTISADKNDYMYNRQRKDRWAGWSIFDDEERPDGSLKYKPSWVRPFRQPGKRYDFHTRKYGSPTYASWTGVRWQPEPNEGIKYPSALRNYEGKWYEGVWD
ncbi:hypothetical protein GQ43DRAFT_363346 [Delitschia confertaspora ATCC 74209]|uniref:Uncharacterized protein n=1 Tax=Delitschia confertaspora ATCC 74209 TaxID=1513339 RepID=A0A9P4JV64_9PLEO|nr:hypothetical protein GQ43DRAFT_363346 [Delitschia confertaspora ATCC 74209]